MNFTRRRVTQLAALFSATAVLPGIPQVNAQGAERPTLVVAVNDQPAKLEPADNPLALDMRVTYSVFDTLIRRDYLTEKANPEGGVVLVPGLATQWRRIDERTVELTLREGVRFHNGDPFTAEDVAFTFSQERLFGEKAMFPSAKTYLGEIEPVEVIDPLTVRIRSRAADPVLELRLADPVGSVIGKSAYAAGGPDGFKRHPIGTGPAKFVNWKNGDSLLFDAYDDYWGGRPNFSSITYRVVPELAARVAGLINGEYDIALQISPDQFSLIEAAPGLTVRGGPIDNLQLIWFVCNESVVSDKRLRQAMSLAIDRQLIVDSLWAGKTTIPNSFQIPSFGSLYNPDRKDFSYDPERAKALVKEAGYTGDIITIRNVTGYYPFGDEMIQVVQKMWQDVGLNVKLEMVESFSQVYTPGRAVGTGSANFLMPAPEGLGYILFGKGSTAQTRHGFVTADNLNAVIDELKTSADPKSRYDLYQQALDILADEVPATAIYLMPQFYGVKSAIHWTPYPGYWLDFRPDNLSFAN
ncbi:ABC transporter substrate-binding protein [Aquamicrobium sp. LC103]|uniref:ABC transporter substrate-binding protein n=1 Tax=Aquamicrobium sp. LC103 TaxID=1120658 RepID=UPI00063E877D|nr:ABC transporter substrate-binding protein [Aquamicrobium sp. LC103]TKT82432.1 oligopeptide ABC transporter substrate-binding protein [Aquamicrobium sp. LC103]